MLKIGMFKIPKLRQFFNFLILQKYLSLTFLILGAHAVESITTLFIRLFFHISLTNFIKVTNEK